MIYSLPSVSCAKCNLFMWVCHNISVHHRHINLPAAYPPTDPYAVPRPMNSCVLHLMIYSPSVFVTQFYSLYSESLSCTETNIFMCVTFDDFFNRRHHINPQLILQRIHTVDCILHWDMCHFLHRFLPQVEWIHVSLPLMIFPSVITQMMTNLQLILMMYRNEWIHVCCS